MDRSELIGKVAQASGLEQGAVEAVFAASSKEGCAIIPELGRSQIQAAELEAASEFNPFLENAQSFTLKTFAKAIAAANLARAAAA